MESEYKVLLKRFQFMTEQRGDLQSSLSSLQRAIEKLSKSLKYTSNGDYKIKVKSKIRTSKRKVDITKQNIERTDDILKEVEKHLETLKANDISENIFYDRDVNVKKISFISKIDDELLNFLSHHPSYLYQLHSRKFEELMARIFKDFGYDVELTRATHDGGKDLILRSETPLGLIIAFVECKRYSRDRAVGIETVRSLYGVQVAENVNKSMIITTSFYSNEAQAFASGLSCLIDLREYDHIVNWLGRYKRST